MSQQQAPDHTTHQPIRVSIPTDDDVHFERERLRTPSLWQPGVQVTHRADEKRTGTVRVVDHMTNQFRLVGQGRTQWESFEHWIVLVEKTPEEKAKDEAREMFLLELEALDPDQLLAVEALCDDPDPAKALAKFNGLKKLGVIGAAKGKK